jgi:hypothetical protein
MVGEFLLRLAVALPLVCALAVVSLLAVKRGWLRMPRLTPPGRLFLPGRMAGVGDPPRLDLVAVQPLTPSARLAVVRFDGREHLVGVSGQSLLHIASSAAPPADPSPQEPARWTS